MNDIEREIAELEELIRLQRMKCDLLHRKNSEMASDTNERSTMAASHSTTEKESTTMNVLHQRSESKDIENIATRISDKVRHMVMSTTDFKEGKENPIRSSEEKSVAKTEDKLIASPAPAALPEPPVKETKEDRFVNAITRLSRLNTDLANERNLLAWARTALASARTFLAFVGVSAVTDFGKASRQICYLGFAVMSIYIILQGTERYNKIKKIVYLKNPPPNFDRLTNAPLPVCLALLFALGLMSISFDQWED